MSAIAIYILEAIFAGSYAMSVTLILLPPALVTIVLLSAPMPDLFKRGWITLLDLMLFKKIDIQGTKFTLYKLCVIASLLAFLLSWGSTVTLDSWGPDFELATCVDSKEWWCSLITLTMYLTLDRFRRSVKNELGMYNKNKKVKKKDDKKVISRQPGTLRGFEVVREEENYIETKTKTASAGLFYANSCADLQDTFKKTEKVVKDEGVSTKDNISLSQNVPPIWMADKSAAICTRCDTPFTLWRRRHHCRACGFVVCGSCSNKKAHLPFVDAGRKVRVCTPCQAEHDANLPVF
jgi:hypothetical protein